jgi:hypothetical protein
MSSLLRSVSCIVAVDPALTPWQEIVLAITTAMSRVFFKKSSAQGTSFVEGSVVTYLSVI